MMVCLFLMMLMLFYSAMNVNNKMTGKKTFYLNFILMMAGVMLINLMTYLPLEEEDKFIWGYLHIDTLSLSLVLLSFYLIKLMVLSSYSVKKFLKFYILYINFMLLLLLTLLLSFFMMNMLLFYFFFELSLIPTLIIIMGWGYQPERLQAGIYFMLYTLVASLPLLMNIFLTYNLFGSLWMSSLFILTDSTVNNLNYLSILLSMFLVIAFLVKMPMFLVHLWLPKAHVEAPVAGSMILAGVLLKLGGYGICRIMVLFFSLISWITDCVISLSILGMVFVGLACCRLNDMKALVAYSSVAHMGLVLCGLFTYFIWGLNGGLMMMLSHGLVSSGMFCSVNMFYERMSSRSIFMNKGLVSVLPIFCLLVFLLCCFNISAPPSINLLSEIFLMISVLSYDKLMILLFPLGSFLGAVFTFYLFSYSQHGKFYNSLSGFNYSMHIEYELLTFHLIPVILLILCPSVFMVYL